MNMWQESQLRPFPAFVSLQTYSEVSVSILRTGFGEIIKYYWFSGHWFKGPPCTRPTKPQFPHTLEDDSELQGKKCMKYSCAHTLSNVWHFWDHPEIHADTRKTHKSQQKVHFSAEWQERKPGYSSLAVFQHAVLSLQCPSCNDLAAGWQEAVRRTTGCVVSGSVWSLQYHWHPPSFQYRCRLQVGLPKQTFSESAQTRHRTIN